MDKPFYVTDGMNKIGPFSKDEVLHMLYNAHISIMDYIVDSRDNRMCPLLQHEDFGGDGSSHSLIGTSGIAGLTPKSLSNKYGFNELRQKTHRDRDEKINEKRSRRPKPESHLKEVIDAKPELAVNSVQVAKPQPVNTPATAPNKTSSPNPSSSQQNKSVSSSAPSYQDDEPTQPRGPNDHFNYMNTSAHSNTQSKMINLDIDEQTTTTTLKSNNSVNFYLKVKDKEYGPLKFLILLSLLKQNKLTGDALTRSDSEKDYRKLSDYLPKEIQKTIHITPIASTNVLPKSQWKRKNVRIDYEEMVLFNNSRHSLVGKSVDLSAEGIAIIWVYDIPVNEEFDISLFDIEKNMFTVRGRLTRKEPIDNEHGIPFYKAVFIFKEKIPIKNFIG